MNPDESPDGGEELATELEAMWAQPSPADVLVADETVTVQPLPANATSRAPYLPSTAPVDASARPGRSTWRDAGRSWAQAAARLRAESSWWHRNPHAAEIDALRRRADAARHTGRALDALTALGYVVLHDRVLAGTAEVLDHVLAGPPGLLLVGTHPVTRLTRDPLGVLYDAGVPLPPEITALRARTQHLLEAVLSHLPGWQLACYPAISLVGAVAWPAWVGEPASLLTTHQLPWWARTLPAPLAPIHVADLALALTATCPPKEPR